MLDGKKGELKPTQKASQFHLRRWIWSKLLKTCSKSNLKKSRAKEKEQAEN
jgi:hypothetical protein